MRGLAFAFIALSLALAPAAAQDVPSPKPRPRGAPSASAVLPTGAGKPAAARPSFPTESAAKRSVEQLDGQVFMLRGLLNVFSLGIDSLARKLRAKDIPVRVLNYAHWRPIAAAFVSQYRTDKSLAPVVIVGHSLGADGALNMGNYLAENGVPVRLVVAFDGVHEGHKVAKGVAEVVNYYKPDGWGKLVEPGPGFRGKLVNVDLSGREEIDHLNIEKSDELHDEVIARLVPIFGAAD